MDSQLSLFLQKYEFKNKKRAKEHIKQLLQTLQTLPKYTKLENDILHDLPKLHYYFHNHTASYFTIERSAYNTNHCFYFHTEGGFHSEFSYIKCFNRNVKKLNSDATFCSLI